MSSKHVKRDHVSQLPKVKHRCPCGKMFLAHPNARYHSAACRQSHFYWRFKTEHKMTYRTSRGGRRNKNGAKR